MASLVITHVGDPENPGKTPSGAADAGVVKPENGTPFRWTQVRVAMKMRGRIVTASRNFILDRNDTVDLEALRELRESQENLAEGADAWELRTVDIVPVATPFTDADGKPRMQVKANVVVLPGETLRAALAATNREFRLLEDGPLSDAPASGIEDLDPETVTGAAM